MTLGSIAETAGRVLTKDKQIAAMAKETKMTGM